MCELVSDEFNGALGCWQSGTASQVIGRPRPLAETNAQRHHGFETSDSQMLQAIEKEPELEHGGTSSVKRKRLVLLVLLLLFVSLVKTVQLMNCPKNRHLH